MKIIYNFRERGLIEDETLKKIYTLKQFLVFNVGLFKSEKEIVRRKFSVIKRNFGYVFYSLVFGFYSFSS